VRWGEVIDLTWLPRYLPTPARPTTAGRHHRERDRHPLLEAEGAEREPKEQEEKQACGCAGVASKRLVGTVAVAVAVPRYTPVLCRLCRRLAAKERSGPWGQFVCTFLYVLAPRLIISVVSPSLSIYPRLHLGLHQDRV
jgi:hypothetical protein